MPRLRRRLKGRAAYSIEKHGDILTSGHDYFGEFLNEEHRLEAWKALRSDILPAFILEHPGERPESWWRFDMPEGTRRECTSGQHPHDDPTNGLLRDLYYGIPRFQRACDRSATYETQTDYLRRHSLLSAAELTELSRKEATS